MRFSMCRTHAGPIDLPQSPLSMAIPLIAQSGVWRSQEQYETTIYLLWPLQLLWKIAMREGTIELLRDPAFIARHTGKNGTVPIRRVFVQGEGGSGKTHFLVEVVMPIARHFFGEEPGVKAIAATNATARLLLGSTMHAAGKLTRGQSLKAKGAAADRACKEGFGE